jgi:hypothetical protein
MNRDKKVTSSLPIKQGDGAKTHGCQIPYINWCLALVKPHNPIYPADWLDHRRISYSPV